MMATVLAKKIPTNIQFLSRIKSNRVNCSEGSSGRKRKFFAAEHNFAGLHIPIPQQKIGERLFA
jgi:hypothetical protein